MKLFLFLCLFTTCSAQAQYFNTEIRFSAGASLPVKLLMPRMSAGIQGGINYTYRPKQYLPIGIDAKLNWSNYSSQTISQTFLFGDGTGTITDVSYSSNFNHFLVGSKLYLGRDYHKINGFITPQIGWGTMKSKIVVADPADEDDCEVLDREQVQLDRGFVYGAEAGINLDLSLFAKNQVQGKHFFTLSAQYLSSHSNFSYVNVKYMKDHDHALHNGGEVLTVSEDGREDITAKFINVSNNNIHEHKIAELYQTPLRMWQISLGYTYRF